MLQFEFVFVSVFRIKPSHLQTASKVRNTYQNNVAILFYNIYIQGCRNITLFSKANVPPVYCGR